MLQAGHVRYMSRSPSRLRQAFIWLSVKFKESRVYWGLVLLLVIVNFLWIQTPTGQRNSLQVNIKGAYYLFLGLVAFVHLWRSRRNIVIQPIHFLGFLFFLWIAVSALYTTDPLSSMFTALLSFLVFIYIITLYYGEMPISALKYEDKYLRSLYVGLTLIVLLSLVAFLYSPNQFSYMVGKFIRLRGITGHPNVLGFSAAMAIIITILYMIPSRKKLIGLVGQIIVLLLSTIALVLTNHRAILVYLLITLFAIWFITALKSKIGRGPAIMLMFLFITFFILSMPTLITIVEDADLLQEGAILVSRRENIEEITTITGRTNIWSSIIPLILEKPLTGHGFRSGEAVLSSYGLPSHAHNMYLEVAFAIGVVGLALFIILLIYLMYSNAWLYFHFNSTGARVRLALVILFFLEGITTSTHSVMIVPKITSVLFWSVFADTARDVLSSFRLVSQEVVPPES